MSVKEQLKHIENRLQHLIETYARRLIPSSDLSNLLANRLVQAMGEHLRREGERYIAPNIYQIEVAPALAADLQDNPALLSALATAVQKAGGEAGFVFPTSPQITIVANPDLGPGEMQTSAKIHLALLDSTKSLPTETAGETTRLPANAFLIINGNQVFPLTQAVVNLGRRVDNTVVLDDPSVSRVHAQMRAIDGHYVLFDLGSTGGTYVNGQRVDRIVLYPGDVISLAKCQLVYGQDAPRPLDETLGYTRPMPVDQNKTVTKRKADNPSDKNN